MRGVKSHDLLAIVDFLYHGEANVFQENLDSFLAVAEELQLKGLTGKMDEKAQDYDEEEKPQPSTFFNTHANIPNTSLKRQTSSSKIIRAEENRSLAIPSNFSGDMDALDEKVKSMMEKSQNFYQHQNIKADICKVCGKEGRYNAIKDHIEANHLEGIAIPCNLCDKTFRSRDSLRHHKLRQHQN